MSIFLKPGMVKVRQEDDEFSEINILAESSSQAYLDAIQAKGEEVLESIPSEYSDLVEEVDGKLDSPQTAGTTGQVLTSDGQGGQSWETPGECTVTDVQVNGASILNDGVANIPTAATGRYGAVKLGSGFTSDQGIINVDYVTAQNVKDGASQKKALTPYQQHLSAFYGLAKAAGDATQSASSNPVGTYTSEAKAAIKSMLGVQDVTVDSALSNSSANPVENRVVKQAIDDVVIVSETQPVSPNNEIWIESDGDSVEIPTMDDVVTDVQVNGNSITNDGVANIPLATGLIAGVAKFQGGFGIGINNSGLAYAYAASDSDIKNATDNYRPVVSSKEHAATFYGLAKAAGDATQSQSSNSVGTYTDEAKSAIQNMLNVPDKSDITVDDVQIDGTSVVNNGVAEIPKANPTTFGVTTIDPAGGLYFTTVENKLAISRAGNNAIKTGSDGYRPIVPYSQHLSTFYGLACAAGDTTQSASSNAVGTYTEEAKSAISDMLNAPVQVSGTTPSINAKSGIQYICGEVATLAITVPASGCIDVVFTSGSTPTALTITSAKIGVTAIKWANGFDDTNLDANTTYEINILNGEYGVVVSWT